MLVALCPQINQNLIELELELLVGLVRKLDDADGRLLLGLFQIEWLQGSTLSVVISNNKEIINRSSN